MVWKYRFGKERCIKQINYIREWERNSGIQPFRISPFFIEYLWWLLLNSNLIFATQILTKTKRSYFYILILATQIKQTFFSYIININENLKNTDEKKCCFKRQQSHISWSNTDNYVGKTCSQKFHLHVRFITHLNTFACAITCLSWKGLHLPAVRPIIWMCILTTY